MGFKALTSRIPGAVCVRPVTKSPGGGNGNSLQDCCLENPVSRGAWWLQSVGSQGVRDDCVCTQWLGRVGEAGSDLASKYQIIICPFEALLDLGFKEFRCLRRVSSGTDIFRIRLHLQNILASFGPWDYIPSSNGLCMAAMPKSCSVPVPPADVLEGTACFIEVL